MVELSRLAAKWWAAAKPAALAACVVLQAMSADLLFFFGLACLSIGAARAWEPLGLIVFGAFICVPMLIDRMRSRKNDS